MSLGRVRRQKSRQLELPLEGKGEARPLQRRGETPTAANGNERSGIDRLMEQVVAGGNVKAALKRVKQNKGSPGVDGMTVDELPTYLAEHGEAIRAQLLDGTYQPKPVRRQEIPKRGGGVRELGIPCVLDRLIQQAILQVLQPMFDPTFSEHSHGFRPGRNAHDAVCEAQRYMQEGKRVVVDVDLEKFFDRVCHAAVGLLSLRMMDELVKSRKELIAIYRDRLTTLPGCWVQKFPADRTTSGNYFVLFITDSAKSSRDEVYEALKAAGIQTKRYFYPPVHEHALFQRLPQRGRLNLQHTMKVSREALALPLYSHTTLEEINHICLQVERLLC